MKKNEDSRIKRRHRIYLLVVSAIFLTATSSILSLDAYARAPCTDYFNKVVTLRMEATQRANERTLEKKEKLDRKSPDYDEKKRALNKQLMAITNALKTTERAYKEELRNVFGEKSECQHIYGRYRSEMATLEPN